MFEFEMEIARDACGDVELPRPFVLVGQGGLNVIESGSGPFGSAPFVVDGEGVVLRGGAVYVWCCAGCCTRVPQQWQSVDAAAEFHGSYIVDGGSVRVPGERQD